MAQRVVRAKRKIALARHPVPAARRRRAARPAGDRAARRLPGLQRGLRRHRRRRTGAARALRGGRPAGPAARRPRAGRPGGPRASSPWCSCRTPAGRPAWMPTAAWYRWLSRTAPVGTRHRQPRGRRSWSGRSPRVRSGPFQLQAAVAAVHAQAPRRRRPTGRRSTRSTACTRWSLLLRSSRSTGRWRWPASKVLRPACRSSRTCGRPAPW